MAFYPRADMVTLVGSLAFKKRGGALVGLAAMGAWGWGKLPGNC